MRVWLVDVGCYNSRYISGVYSSRDAALKANPIPEKPRYEHPNRPAGWQPDNADDPDNCEWSNGLDWDEAASAIPMEVED